MPLKNLIESPKDMDDTELALTRNVVKMLAGHSADMAIAVLIKVLESLLVGAAPDKGSAIKFVASISKHLKRELNKKPESDYGYLYENEDKSDAPILHDKLH